SADRADTRRPGLTGLGGAHRAPGVPGRARVPAVRPVREAGDHVTTATATEPAHRVEVERATRASRAGAVAALVAVAVLGTAPLWARTSVLRTLIGFFTLLALASMWNLLAGYARLVSIKSERRRVV